MYGPPTNLQLNSLYSLVLSIYLYYVILCNALHLISLYLYIAMLLYSTTITIAITIYIYKHFLVTEIHGATSSDDVAFRHPAWQLTLLKYLRYFGLIAIPHYWLYPEEKCPFNYFLPTINFIFYLFIHSVNLITHITVLLFFFMIQNYFFILFNVAFHNLTHLSFLFFFVICFFNHSTGGWLNIVKI